MNFHIDILSAQMALGFRKDIKDGFSASGKPVSASPELTVPPSLSLTIFSHRCSLMEMVIINNIYYETILVNTSFSAESATKNLRQPYLVSEGFGSIAKI